MKAFLYSHGGSGNHGCEALVRTTVNIISKQYTLNLFSLKPDEDRKYGIDKIISIENAKNPNKRKIDLLKASVQIHLKHDNSYSEYLEIAHMASRKGEVAVSIGGDNYCYKGFEQFCFKNKVFNDNGIKTALWGCSIEPEMINEEMKKDLANYSLITARESITYEAVKKYNKNTFLLSDPAFTLETEEVELPEKFKNKKIIGLNVSPMVCACRDDELLKDNLYCFLNLIFKETDYSIMLVPHVVWSTNDDRKELDKLYNEFESTGRIFKIEDCSCTRLKGYISKCEMFIGARTHATIAAYSNCIPTLVLGYSVKSKGIAKDIFGTYENYVLPVQNIKTEKDLINAFGFLEQNKTQIKERLKEVMPNYIDSAYLAGEKFKEVFGN